VSEAAGQRHRVKINRALVLTLWGAVVAERLGFNRAEALTLGRAVAGLNAYSKGKAIGLFSPRPKKVKDKRRSLARDKTVKVDLLGRAVPARRTVEGLRAVAKNRPVNPASVERYLESKFGEALDDARAAMKALARSPAALAEEAFELYATFRPSIPAGKKGWGTSGWLDLNRIRALAQGG